MAVNITSIKTSSNGAWQGDNPLNYAFPLLIIQTLLVLLISRLLTFLLRPLRQPKVIAEIVAGIILGPSVLSRSQSFSHHVFPSWSLPILESVASIGLLFFLFLVGLELDLNSIRRSGRKAFAIAAAGISLPFVCGVGVAFVVRKTIEGADQVSYGPFLVFMGVALSITAFPVLARILAELKLLTTPIGETAMAAAAFNDVAAWVLLALAVALSGNVPGGTHKSPLISIWVLLSGVAFVVFMMAIVRPTMTWMSKRWGGSGESEAYICLTLAGVLAAGFVTDLIGVHSIFGAFVFGLTIPKEGDFSGRLIERIEDFVSGLLLPLYFASSGLKTDVAKIRGAEAWGLLALVIATACFGKISGTFTVAVLNKMPMREALALGFLMNTKGLVELIVLNIGKERKVLNDETFAILVLMALFTTFITTPTVMAIYKPARGGDPYKQRKIQMESPGEKNKEVRILACLHGPANVPSIISLVETIRGETKRSRLALYIMHLVELTERSSSIVMALRARKSRLQRETKNRVAVAFEAYGQLGGLRVRTLTAVSALGSMHEDVCSVAEEKRVAMVVLPFHKRVGGSGEGSDGEMENVGNAWGCVNHRVLREAPCSVGVLVDRGLGGDDQDIRPGDTPRRVCVLFFGGPDDREALELAGRMAEHPGVKVDVIRFMRPKAIEGGNHVSLQLPLEKNYSFSNSAIDPAREMELDDATVEEFRRKTMGADFEEKPTNNVEASVIEIGRTRVYELMVVGRGRFPSAMVADLAYRSAEHAELGPVGDILASTGHGIASSILVVQQHNMTGNEIAPLLDANAASNSV
ncbi:cation/H(+) antiporter 20-like [Aristolochia californica]|uniref:cation/H(+) antiporter 20-like n=1 Tax=Aristolochia californica TaxID=171875 RepID=UPI0035E10D07